jgi:phosphate/sulfate permease
MVTDRNFINQRVSMEVPMIVVYFILAFLLIWVIYTLLVGQTLALAATMFFGLVGLPIIMWIGTSKLPERTRTWLILAVFIITPFVGVLLLKLWAARGGPL